MINNYTSILDQFHHEQLTWRRTLDLFKQENAFLKTRLAEALDHITGKESLALAEQFQNHFIIQDEFIDELKHDIIALENSFQGEKITAKQNKLRNEMEYLERNFTQLKNEFNKYVLSVL